MLDTLSSPHKMIHMTAVRAMVQVLDLESNGVRDAEQAIQLGTCSRLWSLTLTANPVCRESCYRRMIVEAVPQLASLDEQDITGDKRKYTLQFLSLSPLLLLPPPALLSLSQNVDNRFLFPHAHHLWKSYVSYTHAH